MIDLTDYTDGASVRAILGLDDTELPDAELAMDLYSLSLQSDLVSVVPNTTVGGVGLNLLDRYLAISAIAVASRTPYEQQMLDTVLVLCPYFVARFVLPSLPMRAMKDEGDGKTSNSRFLSDSVLKALSDNIQVAVSMNIGILNGLGLVVSQQSPFLGVVTPAVDIVQSSVR